MSSDMFIVQVGVGGVGSALAQQVVQQQAVLEARYGFRLGYLALCERSGIVHTGEMLGSEAVCAAAQARSSGSALADLPGGNPPGNWQDVLPDTPCIVVDVTAADGMEAAHIAAARGGHRLVFANKRPLSGTLEVFQALTQGGVSRYEVTVGAGLPIIDTLQRLIDSGDEVIRIEAAMSGTLGYLCSALEGGFALSTAVQTAKSNGWTEPDPRDDLSGADVMRKALILARTAGLAWEMDAIPGEALFPSSLADVSVDEFMQQLSSLDTEYAARVKHARADHNVLRYVATIEPHGASVALRTLPQQHPLAALRGTDNMVVFTTRRYSDPMPLLVVRGPGAGIDVTAAGVLGDIVATAREMTA